MNDTDIIHELMRGHEYVLGSNKTTLLCLDSLRKSLLDLKCTNNCQLKKEMMQLSDVIKNSEPRNIPLIHLLEMFESSVAPMLEKPGQNGFRKESIRILEELKTFFMNKMLATVDAGLHTMRENDVIILHSVSSVVLNILIQANRSRIPFIVFVLEQDMDKTRQIVKTMQVHGITYHVVPEYNAGHMIESATKLFLGAIAVTTDRKAVTAAGSAAIVSMAHVNKLPVYLFVNSLKFSHKDCQTQQIKKKEKHNGNYRMTYFSHDLVDLNLIDHVITEDGKVKNFDKYFHCPHVTK